MNHKKQKNRFSLNGHLSFKEEEVLKLIEDFVKFLWQGPHKPAMYYTQEYGLQTILTLAANGTYRTATMNIEDMKEFCDYLTTQFDNALNMDW